MDKEKENCGEVVNGTTLSPPGLPVWEKGAPEGAGYLTPLPGLRQVRKMEVVKLKRFPENLPQSTWSFCRRPSLPETFLKLFNQGGFLTLQDQKMLLVRWEGLLARQVPPSLKVR